MRAHKSVHVVVALLKLIQQPLCESTLSVAAIHYELRNPTHSFAAGCPPASECVTSKLAIDRNSDINASGIIW